jgi:hypothetical protein
MIRPGIDISFSAETPFRKPDTSKIRLYEVEKSARKNVPYVMNKDSLNFRKYSLKARLKEGSTYLLIANTGSFSDLYGDQSDSTGTRFLVRTLDSYSELSLDISNVKGNTIIQLLDDKEKILSERKINKPGKISFTFLEKGVFRIRAIDDLNGDGKWTTGDYKMKKQPEPVTYLPKQIELKQANFTIEEQWELNNWNQKDQKLRAKTDQGR